MGVASGLWYGGITYLAFTAGANFDALQARITSSQRWVGIIASTIVLAGLLLWWLRRRARR
jgi:membrane protein DedA with SNARE-associated domain